MFVINQDCRAGMAERIADNSIDAIVTDPPYGLSKEPKAEEVLRHWLNGDDYVHTGSGFMGKTWDSFVPGPNVWREAFRCLKPGGYALVFAGSRTQDLMSMALRLAGFEIRDVAMWLYGSGFPKSLDVSKAIDAADRIGASRERALRFTAWMRSTGITARQINEATGTSMASHYLTDKQQPAVATLDLYAKMAHLLPQPPAEILELMQWRTVESENMKRREILETKHDSTERNVAVISGRGDYHITAAHTEAAKQWEGWGTALKPAYEPIIIARKPLIGTVADNVLTHGTGGINVDGCRVGDEMMPKTRSNGVIMSSSGSMSGGNTGRIAAGEALGRWPANVLHDGALDDEPFARYFYCAKASKTDRNAGCEHLAETPAEAVTNRKEGSAGAANPRAGMTASTYKNIHPTVKPTDLMRYCCRLVTPPGGLVLDPFAGSGSTGRGAMLEGFNFIGFEMDPEYAAIADARILDALTTRTLSDNNIRRGKNQ